MYTRITASQTHSSWADSIDPLREGDPAGQTSEDLNLLLKIPIGVSGVPQAVVGSPYLEALSVATDISGESEGDNVLGLEAFGEELFNLIRHNTPPQLSEGGDFVAMSLGSSWL
jgi:hypothetical protein